MPSAATGGERKRRNEGGWGREGGQSALGSAPESSGGWVDGGLKHSEWMVAGSVPRRKLNSRVADGSECTRMMVPMRDAEAIMVPSMEKESIA